MFYYYFMAIVVMLWCIAIRISDSLAECVFALIWVTIATILLAKGRKIERGK